MMYHVKIWHILCIYVYIYIHTTQFTAALHTLIAVNYTKQNQLLRSTSTEKNVPHVKILTNSPVPLHQLGNSKKQLAAKKIKGTVL